ncbi:MAG: PKD domain-containing protein, partial [Candidatus Thermoplasmatota archaeon]|nr:PKD domain-containing protein [Candidatus Thermoplasmatota archaeon]
MWSRAIANYISPGMDGGNYKTIEEWQSFGDPTLSIADESVPPEKPSVPTGNGTGKPNEEYTFSSSTTDADGDTVYYLFDWGDETFSEWLGPFESGEIVEATHSWDEEGDYQIRVKAKDDHGVQGEWSDPLPVSMPKTKFSFSFFE